jgi:chromate reductase
MAGILAFAGSSREGSYNRKLIHIAAEGARTAGADVTVVELSDFEVPLVNEDLEAEKGMPQKAREFKKLMIRNDGLLIASPEYNSSITPLLKNILDWASRNESADEEFLSAFKGKTAVIMSASPGNLGGLRGLVILRMMLGNLGVTVLPDQKCISGAADAFSADGSLVDSRQQSAVQDLGRLLAVTVDKLSKTR